MAVAFVRDALSRPEDCPRGRGWWSSLAGRSVWDSLSLNEDGGARAPIYSFGIICPQDLLETLSATSSLGASAASDGWTGFLFLKF